MQMIDKEVKVLKGKLSKLIYILLETSFISDNKGFKRSTKELITLLKGLGETKI